MELKELNNNTVNREVRPIRVLQFGEGNFLRAFVDWQIDLANEKGVISTNVAVVTPRFKENPSISRLRKQDGLYHVVLEGIADGKPVRETRCISSVSDIIVPEIDKTAYGQIITSSELRFIVSNTTEAGIRYEVDDVMAEIPATFPGKVTNLLYRRWQHFNGDDSKGLIFLCCELIENNSTTLRECVLRHASEAKFPDDFSKWVNEACIFVDTLVDRIVPGFPADTIDEVKAELGYNDNCVVKGELYHLWVIGGEGWETVKIEFPLDNAGLHVLYMPELKAFRDKKVRILNGTHTGMVSVALQLGCETVMDAFNNSVVNTFINDMVEKEVLPVIDGDAEELRSFAADILERFYNPYIKHYLKSIALNSLSKWETRNWPTVKDNFVKKGKLAHRELFTFAALLCLYAPDSGFTPDDDSSHLAKIANAWKCQTPEKVVAEILASGIFITDFESVVPRFENTVAHFVSDIRNDGMAMAISQFIKK